MRSGLTRVGYFLGCGNPIGFGWLAGMCTGLSKGPSAHVRCFGFRTGGSCGVVALRISGAEGNVTRTQGDAADRAPAHMPAQRVETETGIPAAGKLRRYQHRSGEFTQVRPVERDEAAQHFPGGEQAFGGEGAPEHFPNVIGEGIIARQCLERSFIRLRALKQGRQEKYQVSGLGVIEAGRIVFIRPRTGQSCVNTDAIQVHIPGIAHSHPRRSNT